MPSSKLDWPEGVSPQVLKHGGERKSAPPASSAASGTNLPLVMGIVNVTPDSFYPQSRAPSAREAVSRALRLCEEGADLLDIGGQSTRPGSEPVPEAEEIGRVIPVIEALAGKTRVPISVDTDKAEVARLSRQAGARLLNDVSALRSDPGMASEALRFEAVILMHRGGDSPKTMQDRPSYRDVVREVADFLSGRARAFAEAGGDPKRVLVDPGIGFGKDLGHNMALLKHVRELAALGPVVLGVSRKSFLGRLGSAPDAGPGERLEASLACACWAALCGVKVLRVHDVKATKRALEALGAIGAAD